MTRTAIAVLALLPGLSGALAEETLLTRFIDEEGDRVPLHTVVPVYPHEARRDRIEGDVQVCYHVDRGGRPYRIAVRKSSHRVFEKPAKLAVRASTYVPLEKGATTSGIKTCRTFRFRLDSDDTPDDLSAVDTGG